MPGGASSGEDILGIVLSCTVLALATVLAFFVFWIAVPVAVVVACYLGYRLHQNSPSVQERKAREHTNELYHRACNTTSAVPEKMEFGTRVYKALPHDLPDALVDEMLATALHLYDAELFAIPIPEPPPICNSIEGARYRDFISEHAAKLSNAAAPEIAIRTISESYRAFLAQVPKMHAQDDATFTVPLSDQMADMGNAIEALVLPYYKENAEQCGLFRLLREQLDRNIHEVSGIPYTLENREHPDLVLPSDYEGDNPAYAYLKDTPFLDFFDTQVPFALPEARRFEHHWIVAPPGAGKSTLLQHLLMHDFERVAQNEASVVVIDSNRDLAKSIERLARFAKGGDLDGRLIVIDCEDVEYPVALNIFDTQTSDASGLTPRDREALHNSAVSMLSYIFHALLGAEMTSRQNTLFTFTIELLLALPSPTLDTLIDIMQPDGLTEYAGYLPKLSTDAQRFFAMKFNSKEFFQTKSQVVDRLFAIKRIRALSRMFSSPKTKLNLFDELSNAKVIVINAAKSVIQEDGVEIFTRFFLANILLAAEKRQLISRAKRLPTYLYIDECQDVIRRDERLPVVLDQARKLRLGCILAHQRLGQMTPPVLNALLGSTAIKFAANLADPNLTLMARSMQTTPELLQKQPPFHFSAYIRGQTETALSIKVPHVDFSAMEQTSDQEHEALRATMRRRYAIDLHAAPEKPVRPEQGDVSNPPPEPDLDNPPTAPSSEW